MLDSRGRRARARRQPASLPSARSIRFLLWRLTGGKVHATDATNASRTLLYDIHDGRWGDELLASYCGVPASVLPEVMDSAADFGVTEPISFRQRRFRYAASPATSRRPPSDRPASRPGMMKSTYGTGCFALLNTGDKPAVLAEPAADDDRLPARRQADLRARRLDLHCRRRRAMAARRARRSSIDAAQSSELAQLPTQTRTSISCRPSSALVRPIGIRTAAARCSV